MKEGESVMSYYARTMEISNKMRFHGEKMNDVIIVEKILRSLMPKYDYVVCSIEESKYIDELSLDELQSSLLVHEQKMNRNSTPEEQDLKEEDVEVEEDEEGEETVETEMEVEILGSMMTTAKAEERILTNQRLPNEKDEKSNFVESKETETLLMATQAHEKPLQDVWLSF
ncbi:hypothetical protein KY290_016976 [Solanum tuberosum]|uniref:Polyprotein protein n=1 Tax=Solanum tuberosum TaxID=4113 RepID=A0ABQ7VAU7_SOLTU|nr:hypothetical protein KY284_016051 [Solanum tuberosum]KAH0704276.1 hypothetical protein KY285_018554 [Solanum tuberosum]KAH0760903.1 hypothetical protein KY290_016976 [Solanum tuberosum]